MSYEKFTLTMNLKWLQTNTPKRMCKWKLGDSQWTTYLYFLKVTGDGPCNLNLQIIRDKNCFSWKRESHIHIRFKKSDTSNYKIIELQKPFESDALYFRDILEKSEMFEENGEYPVEITLMLEKFENRLCKVPQFDFKDMNGSPKSDVILNIEGVKLYANKSYLAIHSEYSTDKKDTKI